MPKRKQIALAIALALSQPLAATAAPVPDMWVGPITFNEAPIHVALREIVRGTGLSVVMVDDIPGSLTAAGVTGKLNVIVEKMCGYSNARCDFQNGAIYVSRMDAAAEPVQPPPPPVVVWRLKAGLPIHTQLESWAQQAGWTFAWKARQSWVVPADTEFGGGFDVAVEVVVKALYQQGKPLTLKIWEGNKVAEVVDGSV